jgi:hypothetical protein
MQDSVSQQIYKAAQALLDTARIPGANIAEYFNSTLNRYLTWPFRAGSACITDSQGSTTTFDSVIYTSIASHPANQPVEVEADAVACAVHVVGGLGPEELRAGYEHIAVFKGLKRTQIQEIGFPVNTAPLGIIFAIDSKIPIEKTGESIILLNKTFPYSGWPDMVAILTQGTVNYAVAFLGEPIKGDFFLPNITDFPVMPMYVHLVVQGLGLFSMNKVCGLLFMHLQTFSPGTKLPNMDEVSEGFSSMVITLGAYQFNLKHQLVPARNELWEKGIVAPIPFRIEDTKGKLLAHLQFFPWQDGGVVRLTGTLPLDGILPFLGVEAKNAKIIRRPDGAISSVLPIGEQQFREMLGRFQQQSNMNVKLEEPKLTVSKIADEGTSSPFVARLLFGILRLRDVVFDDKGKREEFDKAYQFVLETLMNARTASKEIIQTLTDHIHKVSQGKIARLKGRVIYIDESIDNELRKQVENFLNIAVRVLKDGMQKLLMVLQLNIGFLYQKQGTFEDKITTLKKTHPELAAYLQETRKWSERLILVRNELHEGWRLPGMVYNESSGTIETVEPQISGQPVSVFVPYMLDRLHCFVEEVSVHGMQAKMPPDISITEIPISDRKKDCPERFQVTFIHGGMPIWSIGHHISKFEET